MAYPVAQVDTRRLERAFQRVPRELGRALQNTFRISLRRFELRLIQERLSGNPIHRRSGQLARGWRVKVSGRGLQLLGLLYTNVPYARIQAFGGTIRPKKSRRLWIPSDLMRDPTGNFRGWEMIPWEKVFYRRSKRNPQNVNAFLPLAVRGRGAKTAVRRIATLVPEVTIEGRMGLRELVMQDRTNRVAEINEAIRFALSRAVRG